MKQQLLLLAKPAPGTGIDADYSFLASVPWVKALNYTLAGLIVIALFVAALNFSSMKTAEKDARAGEQAAAKRNLATTGIVIACLALFQVIVNAFFALLG